MARDRAAPRSAATESVDISQAMCGCDVGDQPFFERIARSSVQARCWIMRLAAKPGFAVFCR
jgi:hypothetical protein